MDFVRRIFILAGASGGAWGAFRLLDVWAKQAGNRGEFHLAAEATPFVVIICLAGGLLGAFLASFVFPARR